MQTVLYIATVKAEATEVGAIGGEGPPVPIPNTEVKLISAENTWLEAARENRAVPTQREVKSVQKHIFHHSHFKLNIPP